MQRLLRLTLALVVCGFTWTYAYGQDTAEFHVKVALAALNDHDLDVALLQLQKARDLSPSNPRVWYNIAVVYNLKEDATGALPALKRAVEIGLPESQRKSSDDLLATQVLAK